MTNHIKKVHVKMVSNMVHSAIKSHGRAMCCLGMSVMLMFALRIKPYQHAIHVTSSVLLGVIYLPNDKLWVILEYN